MGKRCFGCMNLKNQSPVCEHCGYDETRDNLSHQLPVGTILRGQYEIGRVLGEGGFGITYLARDLELNTTVAVKEFFPNGLAYREISAGPQVYAYGSRGDMSFQHNMERFQREGQTLARLGKIPGIVRVYTMFSENSTAYIVMEYVEGMNLGEMVRKAGGRLGPEQTFSVLRPVMEALERIHAAELVHRDISPDNIMIQPGDSAKLLDFGAVREVVDANSERNLSRSTEAVLKHGYAPIEQYQKRGALGPWTDVYALCATIYFCLTGSIPADAPERMAEGMEVGWNQVPGLTSHQAQILEQGMALRTRERLQSVRALMEGLAGSGGIETEKENSRPSKKGWIIAAAFVAVAAVFGGLGLLGNKAPEQKVEAMLPETTRQVVQTWQTEAVETVAVTDPLEISAAETFQEPEQWKDNVLMSAKADMAATAKWDAKPMLGSAYLRSQIYSVTFLDSTASKGEDAWDVSRDGNGSVWAWTESQDKGYALYIAGEGGVAAPESCKELFARLTCVTQINFNGCFHTENVVTMESMFAFANQLRTLDLSGLDTANVRDMGGLFNGCISLESLTLEGLDTGNVRDMSSMFASCGALTQLDVAGFDTAEVMDMSSMFSGCTSLTSLDLTDWNTANVHLITHMFQGWKTVNRLKLGTWETDSIREEWHFGGFMDEAVYFGGKRWENIFFEVMNKSQAQPWEANVLMADSVEWKPGGGMRVLGSRYDRSEIKTVTFLDTTAQQGEGAWDVSQNADGSVLAWVDENHNLYIAGEGGVAAPEHCKNLFAQYGAEAIHFNGCFHTDNVVDMTYLFRDCSNLRELDLSGWETGGVQNMSSMFHGCDSLERIDLSGWDTFWVSDMTGMFRGCESLMMLDLTDLNTSRVTKMREMFMNCASLTGLNLARLDTALVTDMGQMFAGCGEIEGLNLGLWDTGSVKADWGYWNFMDPGVSYDGKAWEELFVG